MGKGGTLEGGILGKAWMNVEGSPFPSPAAWFIQEWLQGLSQGLGLVCPRTPDHTSDLSPDREDPWACSRGLLSELGRRSRRLCCLRSASLVRLLNQCRGLKVVTT